MPSITYWNRLEPRPRAESLTEPLRARLRDPLWLFARQWQMGELQGEDAGSPAHVEIALRTGKMTALRVGGAPPEPIGTMPIERQATAERMPVDLATRIELGQDLARMLGDPALIGAFRDAYAISRAPVDADDPHERSLRRVCGGRSIDGFAVLDAARTSVDGAVPASITTNRAAVVALVQQFVDRELSTWGVFGDTETGAWNAERLEHRFDVDANAPDGRQLTLSATPAADGSVPWHALEASFTGTRVAPGPREVRQIVPANVRFRGMPNARFWDFERGDVDFGGIDTDRRDLGRLAVMEFMLLHSNDWFQIPLELPLGSLATIEDLVVHDVFGTLTVARRTDRDDVPLDGRFAMFCTARSDAAALADFFVVAPTASSATLFSEALEEVRFVRDETANMAWAIEHMVPDAGGEGQLGRERDSLRRPTGAPPPPSDTTLAWTIMTSVPKHWFPLLPVAIDPTRGQIALERGAMLRPGTPPTPIDPRGRILRPSSLGGLPYRIAEDEIPRVGTRVTRSYARSRWIDGSTHLWMSRKRAIGFGEADSALRFDVAEQRR